MSILAPSDFTGTVAIAQNQNDSAKLQQYIDEWEDILTDDLLGCELGDLFRTDFASVPAGEPTAQRFKDIYDKFCNDIDTPSVYYSWSCCYEYYHLYCINMQNKSRGMKEMLKGLIYLLYVRDQPNVNNSIGTSKSKGVASELVPATQLTLPYNRSINDYWNIQYFIVKEEADNGTYPEFNGIKKGVISII